MRNLLTISIAIKKKDIASISIYSRLIDNVRIIIDI